MTRRPPPERPEVREAVALRGEAAAGPAAVAWEATVALAPEPGPPGGPARPHASPRAFWRPRSPAQDALPAVEHAVERAAPAGSAGDASAPTEPPQELALAELSEAALLAAGLCDARVLPHASEVGRDLFSKAAAEAPEGQAHALDFATAAEVDPGPPSRWRLSACSGCESGPSAS